MNEIKAREILINAYGTDREEANSRCFGDCCLSVEEKTALVTLFLGPEVEEN